MVRFLPPSGKVIKLIANARSDEHVLNLEGGRGKKSGEPLRFPGDYRFNSAGQPPSASLGVETVYLSVYAGEPDEIVAFEVIDAA